MKWSISGPKPTVVLNTIDVIREAYLKKGVEFADRPVTATCTCWTGCWEGPVRGRHPLTYWGRDKMDAISQTIYSSAFFMDENIWIPIKISLKFVPEGPVNNIPALVQIMAWRRPGDKPLSEPMMVSYRRIYASAGLNELMYSKGIDGWTTNHRLLYLRLGLCLIYFLAL